MTADPNRGPSVQIATLPRGDGVELRIELAEYKGHRYVGLRQWNKSVDGEWRPDGKRGLSIKLRELGDVIRALGSPRYPPYCSVAEKVEVNPLTCAGQVKPVP